MDKKCAVCRKAPVEHFRVCLKCSKTHDSTTGDRLARATLVRR